MRRLMRLLLQLILGVCLTFCVVSAPAQASDVDIMRDPGNMGTTYVPIESWVYPAIERLAAQGYVRSSFAGQRPWTRMECARLISEADDVDVSKTMTADVAKIYQDLSREFAVELKRRGGAANVDAWIESMYVRNTGIAGTPITDGYHFAQTLVNNYGRPYGVGSNIYTGLSLRGNAGPFSAYVRGEFQRAGLEPTAPAASEAAITAGDAMLAGVNAGPVSGMARGRLLDAYVSLNLKNNQLSFGRQTLWWGPTKGGPVLYSNNAEPVDMLRYDRVTPFTLPSIGGLLGPIRVQLFVGRLSGHQYVFDSPISNYQVGELVGKHGVSLRNQPFINGQKFSFKPSPNLEFSLSRTVIFGGPGSPVTVKNFFRSLFSTATTGVDPGDRRTAVDFSYRVPGLRDWLTVYAETFSDDEPFPLQFPKESVWSPGFYLPKLPYVPKMDFRMEGYFSPSRYIIPGYYYYNFHYLSGYTNDRQLIGSWIGREGRGEQAWTTYWFSPRNSIQANYRNMSVDRNFNLGGTLHDASLTADYANRSGWSAHITEQYERWDFPLFSPGGAKSNFSTTVEVVYSPRKGFSPRAR
jgi:hypothetical protein